MSGVRRIICFAACTLAAAGLSLCVCRTAQSRTLPPLVVPSADGARWNDAERAALRSRLDALFARSSGIRGAHVGLYALDTRDGSLLYARQADDEFMPASTLKLLVGSVALARLGPNFRFHTEAIVEQLASATTQPQPGAPAAGVLILRGQGDPFLKGSDLDALAKVAARNGVTSFAGVAIDSSYFDAKPYPPGWVWDDFPFYYAPVVSAMTYEENVLHIAVSAGPRPGAPAVVSANLLGRIDPSIDRVCSPTRRVVVFPLATTGPAGTESTIDVTRLPGGCIAVIGAVPFSGQDEVDAAVPSPEAYAYDALIAALHAAGISVGEAATANGPYPEDHLVARQTSSVSSELYEHDSNPLPKIVTDMWFPSDNLVAELLLKSLGVARSGVPGTTENGAAFEREWLHSIGVDTHSVTLADGSGLSIYDRITPRDLVAILQADWNGPNRHVVLDALPVAGVRGTLREEFVDTPAAGRAFVKTGSMTHVRGLAGYVETRRHGSVTFALMVDDWNGDADRLNDFRGSVMSALLGTQS